MSEIAFVIEDGVAIPPRTVPNAGPRESKYPVDALKQGQSFAIALGTYGEDGSFTQFAAGSEEAEKQARQKQSQMSGLAKNRKIKLLTRYYSGVEGLESPFASVKAPCLGVWHDGEAKPKQRKAKEENAAPQAPAAPDAPQAPAAPASDDVVTL